MITARRSRNGQSSAAAEEAWQLVIELFHTQRHHFAVMAADVGLTPQQAFAMTLLSPDQPRAMNELAESLTCDASNVTGIVDRLEARGLVERRSAGHDRRVKTLAMTAPGAKLHKHLRARMNEPPHAIAALSRDDRRGLRDILRRALDHARPR
ncbi:MAG: MarR family transcriptional regulator [Candidatus Eremiobacteraeota bacterium]|nr:MarR family transcriptional regulator [Candidatus Eremiobacteraeota bacterium]MBC5826082.1 MarR family transcriptional regulator [Candidatus Eremiobacteraeota bacterium]